MTFREKTVAALLLLVARLICEDELTRVEIKNIANHISVHGSDE